KPLGDMFVSQYPGEAGRCADHEDDDPADDGAVDEDLGQLAPANLLVDEGADDESVGHREHGGLGRIGDAAENGSENDYRHHQRDDRATERTAGLRPARARRAANAFTAGLNIDQD